MKGFSVRKFQMLIHQRILTSSESVSEVYSVVKDYIIYIVSSLVQVYNFHIGAPHSHHVFHPTSGCEVLFEHIGELHKSVSCTGFQRYNIEPSQAPDLQYCEHQPCLPPNGTLHVTANRHVPDSNTYQLMLDLSFLLLQWMMD